MKTDPQHIRVENNPAENRFEARINDQIAVVQYIQGKDYIVIAHTEVPESLEGQGVASKLAHTVLEFAKENALQVMPICPFFASYIRRHPEYKALLRPGFHV